MRERRLVEIAKKDIDRFLSKIKTNKKTLCEEWQASTHRNGHGLFHFNKRLWKAHRFSWEAFVGAIPKAMHVLHTCHNPKCVNPNHLYIGTHEQNMRDKIKDGTAKKKLTEEKVVKILSTNGSSYSVAKQFNVSPELIQKIRNGGVWGHVTEKLAS